LTIGTPNGTQVVCGPMLSAALTGTNGPWQVTSTCANQGQACTATATLVFNGTPNTNEQQSVEGFIIAGPSALVVDCSQEFTTAKAAAHTTAKVEGAFAKVVEYLLAPLPTGHDLRSFVGTFRTDLDDPIADIRCRVERRFADGHRLTMTVARGVIPVRGVHPNPGYWLTALSIPAPQNGALDFFIAEFFTASGEYTQSPDIRPLKALVRS